jgi:plasmid stabilization system protein ParE
VRLRLRPYVQPEIRKEARWYEERQSGLGRSFVAAVDEAFGRVASNPHLYQEVHLDIRRAPLERFPFGVYYVLIEQEVQVLAVTHDARHPSVWKARR